MTKSQEPAHHRQVMSADLEKENISRTLPCAPFGPAQRKVSTNDVEYDRPVHLGHPGAAQHPGGLSLRSENFDARWRHHQIFLKFSKYYVRHDSALKSRLPRCKKTLTPIISETMRNFGNVFGGGHRNPYVFCKMPQTGSRYLLWFWLDRW